MIYEVVLQSIEENLFMELPGTSFCDYLVCVCVLFLVLIHKKHLFCYMLKTLFSKVVKPLRDIQIKKGGKWARVLPRPSPMAPIKINEWLINIVEKEMCFIFSSSF